MTKTFKTQAAQGDLLIRRIEKIPSSAKKVKPENGEYILAHSETGHNHIVKERTDINVFTTDDPFLAYIELGGDVADLEHKRSFDTHATIQIPVGKFEIRRQREYTPEGYRMAAD
jgi:hypothetical protein